MKGIRSIATVVALIVVILAVGCAAPRAVEKAMSGPVMGFAGDSSDMAAAEPRAAKRSAIYAEEAIAQDSDESTRMIVRRANLAVVVEDTDAAIARLKDMSAALGGYISESSRWLSDDQAYARVTLRVPAESLDDVLDQLRDLAIRVDNENVSGEDVTEEYVDLQARLRNLEATETELLALLTEIRENRGKAEEVLAVHREITNIRGQIESLKGREQYLERMTALATVQIEIRPKAAPRSVVDRARWSPIVTGSRALRAFVSVVQVLLDLVIYVLIFSPFLLIPIVVLWLVVRLVRRRRRRSSQ